MDADEGWAGGTDTPHPGLVGAEHLDAMLPFLTEAVFLFDRDGTMRAGLSPPMGLLGYGLEVATNVFTHMHPDDVPRAIQLGAEARGSPSGWNGEIQVRLRHADGTWRHAILRIHSRLAEPDVDGMVVVISEIPARADLIEPEVEAELSAIAEELPTAYLALGPHGRIRFASEAALDLLATDRADLVGLPVADLMIEADQPIVLAAYAATFETSEGSTVVATTHRRYGGRVLEAGFHTRGSEAQPQIVTVVLVDHTEEPELVRLATHDALTGLANRTKVLGTISGLLLDPEPVLSVVYVDLDELKAINDAHGHEAGDQALIAVAHRLQGLVRPGDLVGRMSGDEFVIVCPGLGGSALMHFVQRVGEATTAPIEVHATDGADLAVTVSAGGATATAGDTTASLLRAADEAMFAAKHRRP